MIKAIEFKDELSGNGGSKLPIGIHEKVEFLGLIKDGDWYDLTFGKGGQKIHKRLFKPSGKPKDGETVEQALERESRNNLRHVVKLLHIIMGDAVDKFEAPTYDAFMSRAAAELDKHKGFLLNLKVTPDYKDKRYGSLGFFPQYMEKYVEGEKPKLQFTERELNEMKEVKETSNSSSFYDLPI